MNLGGKWVFDPKLTLGDDDGCLALLQIPKWKIVLSKTCSEVQLLQHLPAGSGGQTCPVLLKNVEYSALGGLHKVHYVMCLFLDGQPYEYAADNAEFGRCGFGHCTATGTQVSPTQVVIRWELWDHGVTMTIAQTLVQKDLVEVRMVMEPVGRREARTECRKYYRRDKRSEKDKRKMAEMLQRPLC